MTCDTRFTIENEDNPLNNWVVLVMHVSILEQLRLINPIRLATNTVTIPCDGISTNREYEINI